MRITALVQLFLLATALFARGAVVSERWGNEGEDLAHPGTITVDSTTKPARLMIDLSAVPKGAGIHHASLVAKRPRQPRVPIRLHVVENVGEGELSFKKGPLSLEPPNYRSFDLTAAVQAWVTEPKSNRGIAMVQSEGLDHNNLHLDIQYEGTPGKGAAQVTALRAVHHDGQTFLIWKELPLFRPAPDKVFWVDEVSVGSDQARSDKPGKNARGEPYVPGITLKTLRDMAGLSVCGKKGPREMQPLRVIRKLPHYRYRVYRSRAPITAESLPRAERIGESAPLCGYVERMRQIVSHGEYYDPYENPESLLPTWAYADGKPLTPGEAIYVHTPQEKGAFYYAVTTVKDGKENAAVFAAGNSLAEPVAETPDTPVPVLQYVTGVGAFEPKAMAKYHHAYWLAPPLANVARTVPMRVIVARHPEQKAPAALTVTSSAGNRFFGAKAGARDTINIVVEQDIAYAPMLGYSNGRDTLKSFSESKVDYFSKRYIFATVDWAKRMWNVDPARMAAGDIHFTIRHPELFSCWISGPYTLDWECKWNPVSGQLGSLLGPMDTAQTVDGDPAWDALNVRWYLAQNPGKDIPFLVVLTNQPKDGNHGAEFGWQDDPRGISALQRYRQPFVYCWGGGGRVSRTVLNRVGRSVYGHAPVRGTCKWDKSLPAFSYCSLNNNPGNGDADDGEPWGQMNGFLLWDEADVVDTQHSWEMTVFLVPDCPEERCTVDITPRRRKAFNPKPGANFKWSNTDLTTGKVIQSGEVTVDKWGLATLEKVMVTKGKNRIVIK